MDQELSYSYLPRVKVCGITSVNDALMAAHAGADAIGCVFYEPSPRYVSIETAADIARSVGPFVSTVGLFVDASESFIHSVLEAVPLQLLQFHGNETLEFCEQFNRPYIKAIRMRPDIDVLAEVNRYPSASAVLLDAYRKGVPGGTGETFDWDRVPKASGPTSFPPIILAGGLTPENVQSAIQQTQPYAVDVSGGVESEPGKKQAQKVISFIKNTKSD